jgi:hypothetical protein
MTSKFLRPQVGAGIGRGLAAALCTALICTVGCASEPIGVETADGRDPIEVVFLAHTAESGLDEEAAAALTWLRGRVEFRTTYLQLGDLDSAELPSGAVLWWHYSANLTMPSTALHAATVAAVQRHLADGGAAFLSLLATPWVVPLGLENSAPDQVAYWPGTHWARWGPDDDRILAGLQSYRGHPLLRRFWGGVLAAWMRPDREYASAIWSGPNWPTRGAVVAVGRRYIGLDPERRVAVEYPPAGARGGRVLAIGEGLYFADTDNHNRVHLEFLVVDALSYLAGRLPPAPAGARLASTGAPALPAATTMTADDPSLPDPPGVAEAGASATLSGDQNLPGVLAATTHWSPPRSGTRWFELPPGDPTEVVADPALLESVLAARSGLVLEREAAGGDTFDLYSPRNLLVGVDSGRIDELWGYPVRVLRRLRFGIVDGDTVTWLDSTEGISFTTRPEGNSFRYAVGDATIDVHIAVPRDRVGLAVVLAVNSPRSLQVRAQWEVDHGVMWPREADHLGVVEVGFSNSDNAVVWRDDAGIVEVYAGFGQPTDVGDVGGVTVPVAVRETVAEGIFAAGTVSGDPVSEDTDASQTASGDTASGGIVSGDTVSSGTVSSATVSGDTAGLEAGVDLELGRVVSLDATARAGAATAMTFVVAGRVDDQATAREDFLATVADPAAVWTANANYWGEFLAKTVAIASPDPTLNEAFRWAKVGLEAFRMTTPGMGTGLAAGFAAAKRAEDDPWAAENDFLRRPGYGWYFGRDAVWSALAADSYGGTDLAEEALRFLARYQDIDGKILHELSPAWVAHYDAADSTPLFLLGLEHHVRATGDRDLLRELWPSVRRAMDFLDATDTDGDGLIENTNVGHGWIEGGKFYGAHTTLYLAGVWAATLGAVERMAGWVADDDLQRSTAERIGAARSAVNEGFWDPLERTFRYGKMADGSYLSQRTILPAVPALLGVTDGDKIRPAIQLFGSAEITTDWGARMAPRSNPDYNPVGYHDGSVWPLYTGWTSLAAYGARQPLTGFLHAYTNLRLVRQGSLGHIPEGLHGDLFEPIGITGHQAWSHALAVLPVIEGLLGIRADAMNATLRIHPQLPGGWRELTVQRVRLGANAFDVTVQRGDESSMFRIERVAGNDPIQFDLALPFPRAALVNLDHDATSGVAVPDGESIVNLSTEKQARVIATLTDNVGVVAFRHSAFPEVIQPLPTPAPGATSESLRVLESRFTAGALTVRVEGLPGRPYRFSIATPWPIRNVAGPRGAVMVSPGPGRAVVELVVPGSGNEYQRADVTIEFVR